MSYRREKKIKRELLKTTLAMLFATGKPLALVKGTTAGPERRAHEMAEAAIERLTAKAAAHAVNNQ